MYALSKPSSPVVYRSPRWAQTYGTKLVAAESTRHGGCSKPPFDALNLGLYTDDHPYYIAENRRLFCQALGFEPEMLAGAHQVHGDQVLHVTTDGQWQGYDALVCNTPGVFISVTVADCTPILLFDPQAGIVGAAHAGWRGTVAQIARKTVEAICQLGAEPSRCLAYIGTCIAYPDFEVGPDVAEAFADEHKRPTATPGKYLVDLKSANRDQLIQSGLLPHHIEVSAYSTVSDSADYFSHRASGGRTGRSLAVIGLKHTEPTP